MFKRRLRHIIALLTAIFFAVGCAVNDGVEDAIDQATEGVYGSWQFGEEQVPVNSVVVEDNGWFQLVVLTPLTDLLHLSTSAIVGVHRDLMGTTMDVSRMNHNYDYVFVYEDPQCYYAAYRPLKSGTITMKQVGNNISLDIDVVLYDGTPFRYSNRSIPIE